MKIRLLQVDLNKVSQKRGLLGIQVVQAVAYPSVKVTDIQKLLLVCACVASFFFDRCLQLVFQFARYFELYFQRG